MTKIDDDSLVARGAWGTVCYAKRPDGTSPAKIFYDKQSQGDKAKLNNLFLLMASQGFVRNREKFKQVEGDLFEFKSHQIRIACYRDRFCWYLLDGFLKKQDKWKSGELEHAKNLMSESQQRHATENKKAEMQLKQKRGNYHA